MYQCLIHRSDTFAESQISKGLYNVKELVEIKIPVNMPGIQNWQEFEPVSGQVQLNGASYNYVKLRVTTDTLFVMCIPNYKTTRLIKDNIIYARQVSDVPLNKKGSTSNMKQLSIDKYNHLVYEYYIEPPAVLLKSVNRHFAVSLPPALPAQVDQPPKIIC